MVGSSLLLAAAIAVYAATPAGPAGTTVYKIELAGGQAAWSEDPPKDTGTLLLFHRYPGGLLVSLKKADVRRIVLTRRSPEVARAARPRGKEIDLGPTGAGASSVTVIGAPEAPPLGARKDGTALLNPDRTYRPEWDTTRVPGLNIPNPNSPNDYLEGKTFAYPPAKAVQDAPGDPPKAPPSSGEPPKNPS